MATFNLEQSKKIYQDAQSKGLDPKKVIYLMAKGGAVFNGIDMNGVIEYGKSNYEPKQPATDQMSPEQADKFLNKSTIGQIFSKETAQELPKAAYETLVGGATKFVKSALESPVNIVQGLQGKEMTTLDINDPVTGKPIGSYQTDFQNKILPAVESGQISPLKGTAQAVGGPLLGASDVLGAGELVSGGAKLVKTGAEQGSKLLSSTKQAVSDIIPPGGGGVGQIASDLASRVPRAGERVKEAITTASERAAKMKTATPQVKKAMKSNLDERIINTIESSDIATKKAFKDVVDIAGEQSTKIGTKKQPTIVGGELATKQFELINKAKQDVGKKLGDAVKSLDKTTNVNVQDAFQKLDNTLSEQGIIPTYDTKGVKLDFTGSRYTPAERTKIQELYDLATEGGDTLTPSKIREKDQLFSKLKRQSQYEGVGDIIVDTAEGPKSLFNVFRDVYSSKLDEISPEIKKLNSEYAKYKNLTDDIEDSIFKTPNFNVTKSTDPAEFAKVNLRRIFGESQSSPVYESIADVMDSTSRGLGYKGASPKVVAEFAQEMRKLFPDTIPSTGFSGGIKLGIGDIVEKITSIGATNLTDKQKAVRDLLQSYFKDTKSIVKPIKKNLTVNNVSDTLSTGVKKAYNNAKDTLKTLKDKSIRERGSISLESILPEQKLKGNQSVSLTKNTTEDLLQQAKKYKSAEEFVKAQGTPVYHGGTEIKEVGNMRSKWGAFYMTDNPTYAKSYGGNKSFLNEMVITPEAKLADLRKPSSDIVKQIEDIISPKKTGKTFKIQKPDGSFIEVPETKGGLSNPVHSSADIIQGIKDGKAYYAEMPEVKEALKKLGYDGMITQESKFGANYGVWNKNVIKTKSQLEEIWKKANKK